MSELVKRTYRVHKDHDKKLKKHATKTKSESAIVREALDSWSPARTRVPKTN